LEQEANGNVDYDSVVDTTTPVYKQLVEAFAEEQAIGDVLYYLSQALENGSIDPDEFLKAVRDQSRNQFMKRAMVFQCRAKAGLPSV
uniref:SB domain-containing protein n=1 Tax=Rodentolepis nana TaxID=102285 RepID=A0A0R3TCS3_RODNA